MKVLKRAEQKNVVLDTHFHTIREISELLSDKIVFYFDDDYNVCFNPLHPYDFDSTYRIDLNVVDELKVIYDKEFGCYETVAVLKNGKILHIEL